MIVYFEKAVKPCVSNEVIDWHMEHGWVWNVKEWESNTAFAVFFCTLLCGDACVVHFDTVPGVRITGSMLVSACRKGLQLIKKSGLYAIYATVKPDSRAFHLAVRFGFRVLPGGGFFRNQEEEVCLLKYLPGEKTMLMNSFP